MSLDRILIPYNKRELKQVILANLSGAFDTRPLSERYLDLKHRQLLYQLKKARALTKDIHFPHTNKVNSQLVKDAEKVRKQEKKREHAISKSARLKAEEICNRVSAII